MRVAALALLLTVTLPAASPAQQRARLDLNGQWDFQIDPTAVGEAQGWAAGGAPFAGRIDVPGAWQAQGVGEPKRALRNDYAGAAWYRRTVAIPAAWRGKSVTLRIGGAHRHTALFVNGTKVGEHSGFSAPFTFDISEAVRPGADNIVALRIANPGDVPLDGPREQKPVQPTGMLNYIGNWGGIFGDVAIQATEPTWVDQVYVQPDLAGQRARFTLSVRSRESVAREGDVTVTVDGKQIARARVQVAGNGKADVDVTLPIPRPRLWSPEDPHLYTATITLRTKGGRTDRVEQRFGMRELRTRGNALLLNGAPLYLRGYGDDNIEVLTGFPPSSHAVYLERLRQARAFGFNAVRFHSMTPPEGFFAAADEVGLLVMAELPAAYTQYVLPHRAFLRQELEGVLMAFRNHPSLLSVAFGNEFNLTWLDTEAEKTLFLETVADFYKLAKSLHPDGLFLSNDGYVMRPTDLVSHYGGALPDLPVVQHEFGNYYCSLPDLSLLDRFTGVLIPEWLHTKKRWVDEQGLASAYPDFVRNSQRLQHLGRKYQIERVRHRPGITGYHYWLIVDFPGGTGEGDSWEEGWFDYFWQPKNIQPRDGQALNAAVLPLITTQVSDRTLWGDATRQVDVVVSNYGPKDLKDAELAWKVMDAGKAIDSGTARVSLPMGQVERVAQIALRPAGGEAARKLDLVVTVDGAHANSWSFWTFPRGKQLDRAPLAVHSTVKWAGIRRVYPFVHEGVPEPGANALLVTPVLDEAALRHLRAGGRVWLMTEPGVTPARQEVAFFPAAGGALGTMVRDHPALRRFPHDGFGDLQFYNLIDGAVPLPLDKWSKGFAPIVGGIRTTAGFLSKMKNLSRVGYVFETRVGTGRLLVTSLRFREHFDEAYPEVLQLFDGLLRYAAGEEFAPTAEASSDELETLLPAR